MAEQKCREICTEIFFHLRDKKTFSKMFDWTEKDLPGNNSMKDIKTAINVRIRDKVSAEIMSKMKCIEIGLSEFVKHLFELQHHAIGKDCEELDRVFHGGINETFTFDEHKTNAIFSLPDESYTFEEKALLAISSPIWIPATILVGAVGVVVIAPVLLAKEMTEFFGNKKVAEYNKNRIKYANDRAEKYLLKIQFNDLLAQIQNGFLKNINERIDLYFSDVIPKRIQAGELLIKNIERPPCEIRKQCHRVEIEIMPIYGRIIVAYTDLFKEKLIPLSEIRTLLTGSPNVGHVYQAEIRLEAQWIPVHVSMISYATGFNDKYAELAEIYLLRYTILSYNIIYIITIMMCHHIMFKRCLF